MEFLDRPAVVGASVGAWRAGRQRARYGGATSVRATSSVLVTDHAAEAAALAASCGRPGGRGVGAGAWRPRRTGAVLGRRGRVMVQAGSRGRGDVRARPRRPGARPAGPAPAPGAARAPAAGAPAGRARVWMGARGRNSGPCAGPWAARG